MTIDDENSIYVGGLPYDCTEDELRRAFELYGAVVAVKIINDRVVGGKCYGFVTFTNPRSATDAINDMNGRPIRGRAVKVNEVRSRTAVGRPNHGRGGFRRSDRDVDRDRRRDRDRGRDYGSRRDQFRDPSHDREHESEREFLDHDGHRSRDSFWERDHNQGRDLKESERGRSRNRDREWESDHDRDNGRDMQADIVDDHDGRGDEEKNSRTRRTRSRSFDRQSREISSDSSDYQQDLEEELRSLTQRREELNGEKLYLEENLEEKKQLLADLQRKTKKLEEVLTSSKKLSSLRQVQLARLQRSFLQVKEYGERLKSSEMDLQALAESLMAEINEDAMVA